MSKSFYNTVHSEGQTLLNFEEKAEKQTDKVLHFFELNKYNAFTPFEVQKWMNLQGFVYPITSIRRAITDLTEEGKLEKKSVKEMKTEIYGKPNHTWQFKLPEELTNK